MVSLRGRDFLTLQDYAREEIKLILQTTENLKRKQRIEEYPGSLQGKILAMIFQKPSTRTSV